MDEDDPYFLKGHRFELTPNCHFERFHYSENNFDVWLYAKDETTGFELEVDLEQETIEKLLIFLQQCQKWDRSE